MEPTKDEKQPTPADVKDEKKAESGEKDELATDAEKAAKEEEDSEYLKPNWD